MDSSSFAQLPQTSMSFGGQASWVRDAPQVAWPEVWFVDTGTLSSPLCAFTKVTFPVGYLY